MSGAWTKFEMRLAALELVIIELTPWLDQGAVSNAMASIKAGLEPDIGTDERTIRRQALQILEDGQRRFQGPSPGLRI